MKKRVHIAILIAFGAVCGVGFSDDSRLEMKPQENAVLALAILNDAIGKQEKLLRQYAGSAQNEAALRLKLAETLQRKAALLTRIPGEEAQYQRTLRQQIFAARWLIDHCEANHNCPLAYLSRGTARKNLNLLGEARADFSFAVEHYPDEVGSEQLLFQLAQMEMDSGDFNVAIKHLLKLKTKSDRLDRPTLLEKLSWGYAGVGDYSKALEITRENLTLVRSIYRPKVSSSSLALNSAIFYARAIESKLFGYHGTGAVEYFQKHLTSEELAVAARSFPGLFTKEEMVLELEVFATTLVKVLPELPATWEVLQAVIERDSSMRRLVPLGELTALLGQYHRKKGNPPKKDLAPTIRRVEKNLLSLIAEKSTPSENRTLALKALRETYSLAHFYFQRDSEPAIQFEFNLGTLEYSEKNYEAAEEHLRNVLETKRYPKLAPLRAQAARELIDIGYRRLKQNIPNSQNDDASISFMLSNWDDTVNNVPGTLRNEREIAGMRYDVARSLYVAQRLDLALPRLKDVLENGHKDGDRKDAIKLVSATYIEKLQWTELYDLAVSALSQAWAQGEFEKTLTKLRDQAIFGQVERAYQAKNHSKVVELVKTHGHKAAPSQISGSLFAVGASSALELNDQTLALSLLDQGVARNPSTEMQARRTLLRASIAEEKWDFETAVREYLKYFAFGPRKGPLDEKEVTLRKRVELLVILLGDPDLLQTIGNHPRICSKDFSSRCSRLKSFAVFLNKTLPLSPRAKDYVAEASRIRRKSPKLSTYDLEKMLSLLDKSPKEDAADTYLAVSILSSMGLELRAVFQNERAILLSKFAVEKDISRLPKRLAHIKRLEAFTERCARGTIPEFEKAAKAEMAGVYNDFKIEIDRLLTIANQGSDYATQLKQISVKFGELANAAAPVVTPERDISTIALFGEASQKVSKDLQANIVNALRSHRWGLVSYLIRAGIEQKRLTTGDAEAAKRAMSELIAKEREGGVS